MKQDRPNCEFHIVVPAHCCRLPRAEIDPVGVYDATAGSHHGSAVAAGPRPSLVSVVIGGRSRKSACHSAHIYTEWPNCGASIKS